MASSRLEVILLTGSVALFIRGRGNTDSTTACVPGTSLTSRTVCRSVKVLGAATGDYKTTEIVTLGGLVTKTCLTRATELIPFAACKAIVACCGAGWTGLVCSSGCSSGHSGFSSSLSGCSCCRVRLSSRSCRRVRLSSCSRSWLRGGGRSKFSSRGGLSSSSLWNKQSGRLAFVIVTRIIGSKTVASIYKVNGVRANVLVLLRDLAEVSSRPVKRQCEKTSGLVWVVSRLTHDQSWRETGSSLPHSPRSTSSPRHTCLSSCTSFAMVFAMMFAIGFGERESRHGGNENPEGDHLVT